MTAYLAGVQERLRAAELARVEAQARAVEERKRRWLVATSAAAMLVMAGLAGTNWLRVAQVALPEMPWPLRPWRMRTGFGTAQEADRSST